MLAAHRDQENIVHRQQVPTKQQPKTPGARYPKTPLKPGNNDENAPTAFAGKTAMGGAKLGGNDKINLTKGNRQALVTPMEPRTRAPLGAKTTNAKAKGGQTGGVKGIVNEIEKTQLKQPTVQKPKPKSLLLVEVKNDAEDAPEDDEEPEYGPPRPTDLPYESDLLPKEGLSFEGLKKENLFRGFYQEFINPVDENGVSRQDKKLNAEMKAAIDKAMDKNEKDLEELDWNVADAPGPAKLLKKKPDPPLVAEANMARKVRGTVPGQPSTVRARKAAMTLSAPTYSQKKPAARPATSAALTRRPLSSLIAGQRTNKQGPPRARPSSTNGTGEVASRTTLGYNKGKSASSMVHVRSQSQTSLSGRTTRTPVRRDDESDLTITPARTRQMEGPRPHFASIFERDSDDEDLAPMKGPCLPDVDDDDEEFELKLDI